jgi:type VI secretion system protein ImpH
VATPGWGTDPSLEEALFDRGYEFEFFQAVRLLARLYPRRKPVGRTAKPAEEIARFGAELSMAFPASAVHDIVRIPDSPDPARVIVAFLGLTGVQGVLPLHYTERLIARKAAKDSACADFFDLFNHRLLSLFYRAWEKHHPAILYESAAFSGRQPDPFTQYLYDLIGMGTDGLRGRMLVKDESLLFYAGLIAQRPHSASALRGILRDYFSVPVEIDQCLGSWYQLEDADRCYLSDELERNQLGESSFIGEEVWNQQSHFRIRVGPLPLESFREFMPDRYSMAKLVELTRYLVGPAMPFEVQVFLRAGEVPYCRLHDGGLDAPRLGWMGWLKTAEFQSDPGDSIFAWVC